MSTSITKRLLAALIAIVFTVSTSQAQAPQKMSFQSVVRNSSGVLVTNHSVGLRLSILQGSISGTAVYVETQTATSNANGLVTLQVGGGTVVSGTFSGINWAAGPYFIKSEIDPAGGTSYGIAGTTQLLSVAYAQYANTAGNINGTGNQIAGYYIPNTNNVYWGQALADCNTINYQGFTNWKLPTQDEMTKLIIQYGTSIFPTDNANYWTSSSYTGGTPVTSNAAIMQPVALNINGTDYNGNPTGPTFNQLNQIKYYNYGYINPDKARVIYIHY